AALALLAVVPECFWQLRANRKVTAAWRRWTRAEREAYHLRTLLTDRSAIKETKANGLRRALLARHRRLVESRAHSIGLTHVAQARGSLLAALGAALTLTAAY